MNQIPTLFAQQGNGVDTIVTVGVFAVIIITIAGMWATFAKAGKPGWACIIPIYNIIVMLEIAGKPLWWILLYFIPFVNIIISFLVIFDLSRAFGKGTLFGLGLVFLPFIFYPLLGFGDAKYHEPA